MSLILDALKKSEQERQEKTAADADAPEAADEPADDAAAGPRRLRRIALIAALPIVVFALGFGAVVAFPGAFEKLMAPKPAAEAKPAPRKPPAPATTAAAPAATPAPEIKPAPTKAETKKSEPATVEASKPAPAPAAKVEPAKPAAAPAPAKAPPPVKTAAAPEPAKKVEAAKAAPEPAKAAPEPAPAKASPPAKTAAPASPPAETKPAAKPSVETAAKPEAGPTETAAAEPSGQLAGVRVPRKPDGVAAVFAKTPSADAARAQRLAREARRHEEQGLYDRAIETYTLAIAADPGLADAYFGRGWSEIGKGAHHDAIGDFTRVIGLRADFAEAYFGRAWALEKTGDNETAIRQYGEAIRLRPDYAEAYFSRGVLEFMAGRLDLAARDFEAVHRTAPGGLGDYALLWRFVSRARAGAKPDPAEAFAGWQGGAAWPGQLVRLFKGEATPAEVIAAAKDGDAERQRQNECVGYFFIAQHRLIRGDKKGAVDYFRRTLATGVTHFRQYAVAGLELKKIAGAN